MNYDIAEIISRFRIDGSFVGAQAFGSGHIHDTFAVTHESKGVKSRTVLQRINEVVFINPPEVMENIVRVTDHIRKKLTDQGADDIDRQTLTVIPTRSDETYYKDEAGNYWRVFVMIENARTYDTMQSEDQARVAAQMFGEFQAMLVDLDGPELHETIVDFHNGPKRFEAFQEVLKADPKNRAVIAKQQIDFVLSNSEILYVLPKLVEKGKIPIRTTHNDTKINNVMFDNDTGKALCVIDLDTTMPGLSLYDFGDIVRTTTSPAEEDEPDLSKVEMLMPRYEAILRGYVGGASAFLNKAERQHLAFAGKLITFEQAVRFLTDYIAGDVYYKTSRDKHNLDRTGTQIKLVESITEKEEKMNALAESS